MDFGEKLLTVRKVQRVTQQELARRSGVLQSIISGIETGKILATPDTEAALKSALDWPERAEEAFGLLEGVGG